MNESGVIFLLGVLFTVVLIKIGDALDRAQRERIQQVGAERLPRAIDGEPHYWSLDTAGKPIYWDGHRWLSELFLRRGDEDQP